MNHDRHPRWRAVAAIAAAFSVPLGGSLHAAPAAAPWDAALASLEAAGFLAAEEIESTVDGGIEAEVFDAQQQEFEVVLDAHGAIRSQRLEAQDSAEERIEIATVRRLLVWMAERGYRDPSSISADDGHFEIEAEDGAGHSVDLDVEAAADGFRVLRSRRHARPGAEP
jgi:hypothetical protein